MRIDAGPGFGADQMPPFLPAGGPDIDCVCNQQFNVGDRVIAATDMPDGNDQIRAGDLGTVVCGRPFFEGDLILVRRDIDNGHDGLGVYCDQITLVSECPGDIDAGGSTGFPDLLRLLSAWGSCVGCSEDLDDDGVVGLTDLLVVLAHWGPCP